MPPDDERYGPEDHWNHDPYSDGNERDPLDDDKDFQRIIPSRLDPSIHPFCRGIIIPEENMIYEVNGKQVARAEYLKAERVINRLVLLERIREAHLRETGEAILASLGWVE